MIAGRDHIGPGPNCIVENLFGNAEAARGVLTVDDHEVQLQIGNQPRQLFINRVPARPAHHITKKSNLMGLPYTSVPSERKPLSVRIWLSAMSCGSSGTRSISWQSKAMPIRSGSRPRSAKRARARS